MVRSRGAQMKAEAVGRARTTSTPREVPPPDRRKTKKKALGPIGYLNDEQRKRFRVGPRLRDPRSRVAKTKFPSEAEIRSMPADRREEILRRLREEHGRVDASADRTYEGYQAQKEQRRKHHSKTHGGGIASIAYQKGGPPRYQKSILVAARRDAQLKRARTGESVESRVKQVDAQMQGPLWHWPRKLFRLVFKHAKSAPEGKKVVPLPTKQAEQRRGLSAGDVIRAGAAVAAATGGTAATLEMNAQMEAEQARIEALRIQNMELRTVIDEETGEVRSFFVAGDAATSPFAEIIRRRTTRETPGVVSVPNIFLGYDGRLESEILLDAQGTVEFDPRRILERWRAYRAAQGDKYDANVEAAYEQAIREYTAALTDGRIHRSSLERILARDMGVGREQDIVEALTDAESFNWEQLVADRGLELDPQGIEIARNAARHISPLFAQSIFMTEVGQGRGPEETAAFMNLLLWNGGEEMLALFPGYGGRHLDNEEHLPIGASQWTERDEQQALLLTPYMTPRALAALGIPNAVAPFRTHVDTINPHGVSRVETDAGIPRLRYGNESALVVIRAMGGALDAALESPGSREAVRILTEGMDSPDPLTARNATRLFHEYLAAHYRDSRAAIEGLREWYEAGAHLNDSIVAHIDIEGVKTYAGLARDNFAYLEDSVAPRISALEQVRVAPGEFTFPESGTPDFFEAPWSGLNTGFGAPETDSIAGEAAREFATRASEITRVDRSLILALLSQETAHGLNVGSCFLVDPETGDARLANGTIIKNAMRPDRDVQPFLEITARLGLDPYNTPISCPDRNGGHYYGGALGYPQVLPSTLLTRMDQFKEMFGVEANPWDAEAAIYMIAMILMQNGAADGGRAAEERALGLYVSGADWARDPAARAYIESTMAQRRNYD